MKITAKLDQIRKDISVAEKQFHRDQGSVCLLAVSKTRTTDEIITAISAGQRHFGENYCQEAVEKIEEINNPEAIWHFIGPIQSNKTKQIASCFDWVHTIDRIKIARRLDEARSEDKAALNICIQINISGEDSKSGITLDNAEDFINQLEQFKRLRVRGLMALPAPTNDFDEQRAAFSLLNKKLHGLNRNKPELDTLSIGTSQDMEAAIAEGATIVRIGTAIFGARNA
ncbi:MAG TPA: YggS family pyridoxal phosphate-dependent enzyme [Thiotrichaceae bacterium]|jgi:pyridoxal phosphate enzyme (YggS family)|nr:YggS family pyridoxal phosphate-dependent enzyme [Thiotrichaceae bacterium]HIM08695.1 YggS family pyridoxal phosphate-dependent enzyme [Gammaproteobacteria bacterium]